MYSTECVYVYNTELVFLQVCVCRLWRVKAIPLLWWSCPTWNTETCTAICSIQDWETVLWLVSLWSIKVSTQANTASLPCICTQNSSIQSNTLMRLEFIGSCECLSAEWDPKFRTDVVVWFCYSFVHLVARTLWAHENTRYVSVVVICTFTY